MGIRFVDVVKGNSTPKDGEQVYITAKFMHNGLKLKLNEKIEEKTMVESSSITPIEQDLHGPCVSSIVYQKS